ncbi:MAG: fibronectin type III domain-containing protein [Tannerella sp.]|nr:fibronectin type III domain-containing protein [Tannerella sp.]
MCIATLPVFFSCGKESEETFPERLFRPATFSAIVDVNNVDFTWMPIEGASYLLEISRDSLMFETEIQTYSISNTNKARIEDLWGSTRYSARIKAVSATPAVMDSRYRSTIFFTQAENLFAELNDGDIGTDRITLRWDRSRPVDHILVSATDRSDSSVIITAEDLAAGQTVISGLDPGTKYTFRLCLGERNRGLIEAATKSILIEPDEADVTRYPATLHRDSAQPVDRIAVYTEGHETETFFPLLQQILQPDLRLSAVSNLPHHICFAFIQKRPGRPHNSICL